MAVDIRATPGASDANCYLTQTEADGIIDQNMYLLPYWEIASVDRQRSALVMATRILDEQIEWVGLPTYEDQALQWPRTSTFTRNGQAIEQDVVPDFVKVATAELACYLLQKNRMADPVTMGFKMMKADTLQLQIDKNWAAEVMPDSVWQIVKYWGEKKSNQPIHLLRR